MRVLNPWRSTLVVLVGLSSMLGCSPRGHAPVCGDGTVDQGETCDDGNTTSADGCSSTCQTESPGATCGTGTVEAGETCDDGNTTDGDGCSAICLKEIVCAPKPAPAKEVVCQALPAGPCTVKAGDGARLLVGTVLTPETTYRGGQVLIDANGRILQVGCAAACEADSTCQAAAAAATAVTCPSGVISPGLINTHDHITYTHDAPAADTGERYEHRHEWRLGLDNHTKITTPGGATNDQVLWGEVRFLFGGATSTVGSGGAVGLVRNLDKATMLEGVTASAPVDFDVFPLNDSKPPSGFPGAVACSAFTGAVTESAIAADDAYLPHVGEGIDAYATNEFVCLSPTNTGHNALADQSAFIHGTGLTASHYVEMAKHGTALIWSPRSNVSLYGNTASISEAARLGVLIALGTDWLPSGSMNLLRELRCADSLNQSHFCRTFSDYELWMMVTANAAVATAVDKDLGRLEPGKLGDVVIFDGTNHRDYRAIIDAEPQDVLLVLRGGKPLYGEAAVMGAIPGAGPCDTLDVCGSSKSACLQAEAGKSYAALEAAASTYPAFFCGTPTNEPSCTPSRPQAVEGSTTYTGARTATDFDGDGLPDLSDNCPGVFNPVRPMDHGVQADTDGDGVGDACDPCPLDANAASCASFDPTDVDRDGVLNAADNCPLVANPGQDDADSDKAGDACDRCAVSNPGKSPCPATIYQVKNGTMPVGARVTMANQLVTARSSQGYYLQVKPGDSAWSGTADYSGVYVYDTGNTVKAGDRVSVARATIADFHGQLQLTLPTTTVASSAGEAAPDPVIVQPADVATGGARAKALESVLVKVEGVAVTDVNPPANGGDAAPIHEFVIDGGLRINDALYRVEPFPVPGQGYASLTGILDFRNADSKLEPRGAADVVLGTPSVASLAPALSFAEVGQTRAPTFPMPLTVTLTNAPKVDTFVAVTSSDPGSLAVAGGGVVVPAGQVSAEVLVEGVAPTASVTLSVTLGSTTLNAAVRVVGPSEVPVIASLTPATPRVVPGGTVTLTVTLDVPAPAAGVVVPLALQPASAGVIPATVTVPARQLSATFDFIDGRVVSSATITATLGEREASSVVTMAQGGGLVLNEVDYDNVGSDTAEYVEILNAGSTTIDLAGYQLVLLNGGAGSLYGRYDLGPGTLAPGQYLVVGSQVALAAVPVGVRTISFGTDKDNVQNGAPDGMAIINADSLVDALSYEGAMTTVSIAGLGVVSLVEGTLLPASVADSTTAQGALCRLPDGSDQNNASVDWKVCSTLTPGRANLP